MHATPHPPGIGRGIDDSPTENLRFSTDPACTPRLGRLLAVAAVDHPGGAETTLLRLLARLQSRGWQVTLTTPGDGPLRDAALEAGHAWLALPVGGLGARTGARALASWPRIHRLARAAGVVYLNGSVCGRLLPRCRPAGRDVCCTSTTSWPGCRRFGGWPTWCSQPQRRSPTGSVLWARTSSTGRSTTIRHSLPGARVMVIGDDPYGTDPAYTRAVTSSPEIEHHPWVANAPGLMRHLEVLVLPSYQEPFGTVLAEAMAVGTPVVATRVGGLAEVVDDGVTGRLVPAGDTDALAAAVLEVLRNRTRMSAAAREQSQRFHTGRYAEHVEQLIAR
jgi:Glycosyl transferases group 1